LCSDLSGFQSSAQVDVSGTGLEHLVNGAMGKALSVYATNDADKVLSTPDPMGSNWVCLKIG
jgi:hypothetical protein